MSILSLSECIALCGTVRASQEGGRFYLRSTLVFIYSLVKACRVFSCKDLPSTSHGQLAAVAITFYSFGRLAQ